jgi:hypothetical protein
VASGAIRNTTATSAGLEKPVALFGRLLLEASWHANDGCRVVAAVLSQHRTGSNFLRDLIGLTVSSRVDVFHEHAVPPANGVELDATRSCFDQSLLESDQTRARLLRRACLREMIVGAQRRFVFVAERSPDRRLTSYFQRRQLSWLQSCFDRKTRRLSNAAEIQQAFHEWLKEKVRLQRIWYKDRLVGPFGLSVLDAEQTDDGCFVQRRGADILLVVPTSRLGALRNGLRATFGGDEAYESVASNSLNTSARGAEIDEAFRRQIRFPPDVSDALWQIPEVARLHAHPE